MVIEEGKISMDPRNQRLAYTNNCKTSTILFGIWKFHRKFIHKYSEIAKPLNDLLKKDKPFDWTNECQKALEDLKTQFTAEPVLRMPDQTQPFQIEADASKYATGAVLTLTDANGDRHPVAFLSKTFTEAE